MSDTVIHIGDAVLTRVCYIDVAIPSEIAGLVPADFADVAWRFPLWAEGEQLRAGAAAWFADIAGTRFVFDPVQAADGVLRADAVSEAAQQDAIAQRFSESGFGVETVDRVVMTHIEGVGMVARHHADGSWSRYFPNARISVSATALEAFLATPSEPDNPLATAQFVAWHALIAAGVVDTFDDGETIAPGLVAEVVGAHCPGHSLLHFSPASGGDTAASMIGHLAISPLHLVTGECPQQHPEPARAEAALQRTAADGRLLIGPLWPTPGCGSLRGDAFEAYA